MKKLIGILTAAIALLCAAQVFAADYPAEIAEPSEAVVTVDGNPVDFCAYNLYGSNYFMLRDIAVALSGTDKQFNIGWKYSTVSLTSKTAYESVGTEFSQNADSSADALFSTPAVTLDGTEITLVGYNINGSNYFKIRDIARIFDFNIGYEYGHISIDTAKPYAPEEPYGSGSIIGMAHEANLALFINEMPIVSYYTAVDTAYNETQLERINENPRLNGVYVSARDLENYGFDVNLDNGIWLTRNKDKKFGVLDGEIVNFAPTGISEVYASDTKVYLDGESTHNIMINGEPYISAAELLKYGNISDFKRPIGGYIGEFDTGVKIEFLKSELESAYNAAGGNEITESAPDIDKNILEVLRIGQSSYYGSFSYKESVGMCKLKISYPYSDVEYIGGLNGYVYDGTGIYTLQYNPPIGPGVAPMRHYSIERGIFRNGELYDGISYVQGHEWGGNEFIIGKRIEGAMVNGYRRESTPLWKNTYYNDNRDDFRFGYRIDREGTIENGEYVGYYREYDEKGKLIFEGDYSDWIKTKQEEQI